MTELAVAGLDRAFVDHRRELTGYCYRMLGSLHEAEDAVQETFLRAWRSAETFEGRGALRSWLYSIATNVCMTMLDARRRRALPMDLASPAPPNSVLGPAITAEAWIQPVPDGRVLGADGDPAELAVARDTIRLAFVAALQHLPPRQRAVLILRDVLRWQAAEVADLLDVSVISVNGLLRRARATLGARDLNAPGPRATTRRERELLAGYVAAFERSDVDALVALLRDDAIFSMPPFTLWLRGAHTFGPWLVANGCTEAVLVPVEANGSPAFGLYKATTGGQLDGFAIQVLELSEAGISAIHTFIDVDLFAVFELPRRLEPDRAAVYCN